MSLTEIKKDVKTEYTHALGVDEIHNFFYKLFRKNIRIVDVHQVEFGNYSLNDLFESDIRDFQASISNKEGEYIQDVIILFVPTVSPFFGHYQLLAKKNDIIYFFDSYGEDYNALPKKVNNSGKVFISDNFGRLVINSGKEIIVNNVKYQTNNEQDSTCGFHSSICGFYFIVEKQATLNGYYEFIKSFMKNDSTHTKYDSIVIYLFKNLSPKR